MRGGWRDTSPDNPIESLGRLRTAHPGAFVRSGLAIATLSPMAQSRSSSDPDGILGALAEIPKGQLSERQARLAAALAMIDGGSSIHAASKACELPYSTLYKQARGLARSDRETAFEVGESALVDAQLTIASRASEIVLERLDDTQNPMRDGDIIKAMGVATDKVAIKRQWSRADSNQNEREGISALARILQGHTVTIEPTDPSTQAVDVTPQPQDTEPNTDPKG